MDKESHEMMHYCENSKNKISNLINCGIYFISVRFYTEFGVGCTDNDFARHDLS